MLEKFETRILAQIDDMVEYADTDNLFASGYLCGHVTLAVAQAKEHGEHSVEQLHIRVKRSLEKAVKAGELSPPDQRLVFNMWHYLLHQAQHEER
ncbi:YfcL family protein [Candidatus Regiella endosymbiont of Tuberolachnus salignus]|uniref:YfcL family protein n=1 Tax=Candidatus Regiella endosymbiont of Tuberolachnus salignus TaxID=3077956 RepID=UPI0030D28A5A